MVEPRVIPRAEHTLSRRDIDPDALKVLYRLRQVDHIAYLVGGSVRDLLLGRRPKDFDIGTSAHPYQVKKLFRNCWIIGRRFRLAHVKFGTEGHRGGDVPAAGAAGRGDRAGRRSGSGPDDNRGTASRRRKAQRRMLTMLVWVVAERIRFDEVAEAHRRLEVGGLEGKLVLCPDLPSRRGRVPPQREPCPPR